MNKKTVRGVIYARYSSDNQREESIEGQVNACSQMAERNGVSIVKVYADRAMTGKNDNRPQFQEMLKDGQNGLFDVLYVWKVDRFGRNRYEIAINKHKLKSTGVRIEYAKENIPDSSEGIILESVLEGMAEYFSANLSENVRRGLETNAEKALYNGGLVPMGYKVENGCFVLDEIFAPLVKKIFTSYVEDRTVAGLERWLKENGYKTKQGRDFTVQTIRLIVKNKRYTGRYIYTVNGKQIEIENAIPRIVSDELFQQAQTRLKERHKVPAKGAKRAVYSFSGKIKCAYCGDNVKLSITSNPHGGYYEYYICRNRRCEDKKGARREKVEKPIFDFLANEILTAENIKLIADKIIELQNSGETIKDLKANLNALDKKIKNITNAIENGSFSPTLAERLQELEKEKDEVIKRQAQTKKRPAISKDEVVEYLSGFMDGDIGDEDFKRQLARLFIQSITLSKDYAEVRYSMGGFIFEKKFRL